MVDKAVSSQDNLVILVFLWFKLCSGFCLQIRSHVQFSQFPWILLPCASSPCQPIYYPEGQLISKGLPLVINVSLNHTEKLCVLKTKARLLSLLYLKSYICASHFFAFHFLGQQYKKLEILL
ncbi:uncharacterized protein LOC125874594 isoform X2 [Solanum stenotomum]|uniref:uncharacterized protein LOC125874594 isoform X2 n=1 Tax=Solanum stenotomum TaxID=172797 RepID=UPI0020D197C4|nr:uncharacterized protein LOC125874594 isoform X2 [Solanum stenotomum]